MQAATTTGSAVVTLPTDTQVLITREFNAPAALVYRAWTTPELVKKWWAGTMGEVTLAEIDLRVGGKWRYVMIAYDGTEVGFHGEYRELKAPERIVSTEVYEGIPNGDDFPAVNTLTLTENNGRTKLVILCDMPNQESRDAMIASGMEGGMQTSMDKLEEVAVSLMTA